MEEEVFMRSRRLYLKAAPNTWPRFLYRRTSRPRLRYPPLGHQYDHRRHKPEHDQYHPCPRAQRTLLHRHFPVQMRDGSCT